MIATSVAEALATLACLRGRGRILAGGTSLLAQLQHEELSRVECLIDVTHIPEIDDIRSDKSTMTIGAATTFEHLAIAEAIRQHAPVLAQAAAALGPADVRTLATLGGNVAMARPAANGALALLALQAEAEIANLTGRQWVPVAQLFAAAGTSRVDPSAEMITAFRFPLRGPHESSAFAQIRSTGSADGSSFRVAAGVLLDAGAVNFRDVRIALGPVASAPCRVRDTERSLRGASADDAAIAEAAELTLREVGTPAGAQEITREELVNALRRALLEAVTRARQP